MCSDERDARGDARGIARDDANVADARTTGGRVRECYLDYAAATPMAPEAVEAMLPYLTRRFHNPSAPYAAARAVRSELEDARARLAHVIGASPANVTLTAGATEANNLAFAATEGTVVTLATEHESTLRCAEARDHVVVPVGADGRVSAEGVRRAVTPDVELVSISLANGEIGTIQPIREIAGVVADERARRLVAGERRQILLHTDASQAAGYCSVNVSSLGADLVTLSAAKVYGPKQVGLLWAADGVELRPLVVGGGQERGLRSGTENVAGAMAFARALELAEELRPHESRRLASMRDSLQRRLVGEFPWAQVAGPRRGKLRLPGLLHISFPGLEARRLVILLERRGVSVGTGSACAASQMRVSHVLSALGLPDDVSGGSLRITLGRPTTEDDVDYAAAAIIDVVREESARLGIVGRRVGEK